jgi:hypothetical protein
MAYNILTGTVIAADKYLPGDLVVNIVSGNLSTSDAASVQNVPRVANAFNNGVLTNVGGDANTLVCESNLTFDGDTLNVVGDITASIGVSASFFQGDGSGLINVSVSGSASAQGPVYSLQFTTGSGGLSGSAGLLFSGSTLTLTGTMNVSGNSHFAGDLLPATADVHDLGSAAKPWRDLYISGSSIHFGNEILSVSDNNLKFGSGSTTKGFDVGFMNFKNNGIFMDPGRIFQLRAYQMQFYGGISYVRRVVVDDYTVSTIDFLIGALTHAESASITLSLPAAGACSNGQTFIVKDEGGAANASPVIILASGSNTIDGQNTIVLESPYASIQLYCNGIDKYYIC